MISRMRSEGPTGRKRSRGVCSRGSVHPRTDIAGGARRLQVIWRRKARFPKPNDAVDVGRDGANEVSGAPREQSSRAAEARPIKRRANRKLSEISPEWRTRIIVLGPYKEYHRAR